MPDKERKLLSTAGDQPLCSVRSAVLVTPELKSLLQNGPHVAVPGGSVG